MVNEDSGEFLGHVAEPVREQAQKEVERIAKNILTNPVIEEFRFEIFD
jgi:phosphoribosylformylglycinamidine (FGAM) synthase PurS component